MPPAIFEFTWPVPTAGFKWSEEREHLYAPLRDATPDRDDVDPVLLPLSLETRTSEPLREHSGMFKQFSEVVPMDESILEFANRYGTLQAGDARIDLLTMRAVPPWIDRDQARGEL